VVSALGPAQRDGVVYATGEQARVERLVSVACKDAHDDRGVGRPEAATEHLVGWVHHAHFIARLWITQLACHRLRKDPWMTGGDWARMTAMKLHGRDRGSHAAAM